MALRRQGGVLRLGNYSSLGEVLGKGTFATVYKGFNSDTMEPVAIKEIDLTRLETMNAKHKEHLKQEVDVMKVAEHPNIVGLLEVRTNRSPTRNDFLFITLEYCNQGDFRKYLDQQRLTEGQALYFMRQFGTSLSHPSPSSFSLLTFSFSFSSSLLSSIPHSQDPQESSDSSSQGPAVSAREEHCSS